MAQIDRTLYTWVCNVNLLKAQPHKFNCSMSILKDSRHKMNITSLNYSHDNNVTPKLINVIL